tara:strand:- start:319 stop:921 length:603 start_codon:yes stop_codon:yes gene_type:complete
MSKSSKNLTKQKSVEYKLKPNDVVFTPSKVAKLMIDLCDIKPDDKVLDCSKGEGVFFDNFPECIKDYCEIAENRDFFKYDKPVDIVCSNPPYSLWTKWLQHTVKLNPKKICYIFGLLNLTPARLSILHEAGYIITKFHICKIAWWFSPSFIVLFEKGNKEDTSITYTRDNFGCEICGQNNHICKRGRTVGGRKYGLNECL